MLQEKIVGASQELQDNADQWVLVLREMHIFCLPSQSELRELNLPASLEALERPIGLPPSLLKRAEEVRSANGPTKLEASINDVQKLAHRALRLLDEVTVVGHRYTENNSKLGHGCS